MEWYTRERRSSAVVNGRSAASNKMHHDRHTLRERMVGERRCPLSETRVAACHHRWSFEGSDALLARCLFPSPQLVDAPFTQVVHVLQELRPGHHAGSRVWSHEARARPALGIGTHLLAHVLANAGKL